MEPKVTEPKITEPQAAGTDGVELPQVSPFQVLSHVLQLTPEQVDALAQLKPDPQNRSEWAEQARTVLDDRQRLMIQAMAAAPHARGELNLAELSEDDRQAIQEIGDNPDIMMRRRSVSSCKRMTADEMLTSVAFQAFQSKESERMAGSEVPGHDLGLLHYGH